MKVFKKLGFDLGYLALLTKEDVKPLSRWEGGFSHKKIKALQCLGLKTGVVERRLLNGGNTSELIFSKSSNYLDFYTNRFDKMPIKKDYETKITEGFLFGYPGCCARNFAENGYTENKYAGNGQEILFHWVCQDCRITPSLLPYYEKVHNECKEIFADQGLDSARFLKNLLPAAALSLLFSVLPANVRGDDPHWLPLGVDDPDNNYLTYSEEVLLGTQHNYFPQDSLAGPAKALDFKAIVDSLPVASDLTAPDSTCYIVEHLANGFEYCQVCGDTLNMGFIEVVNPMRDLSVQIPFMGLHFLENGSFSFDGTENSGRIDIELLKEVLAHYDTTHYSISTSNDGDNDGLNDEYEDDFGTQLNNPDSNGNQLVDGAEVAEELIEAVSGLPAIMMGEDPPVDSIYIEYCPTWGMETCDICGIDINMGFVHIVNPVENTEINFSIIGLHYLAHGRFAYGGSTNSGEIDALELAQVLGNQGIVTILERLADKKSFSLKNYPTPFNTSTVISYSLPEHGLVNLTIYNVLGQRVKTLVEEFKPSGSHKTQWDGTDDQGRGVSSGVYIYQLRAASEDGWSHLRAGKAGNFVGSGKMLLIR
ncbi:T9SS type A sorting domain-containing protein [candidate division KSB1 bacterium]|nr:T9SS type A sorting domain-containing protein [candidate division KSB1 bacterium]